MTRNYTLAIHCSNAPDGSSTFDGNAALIKGDQLCGVVAEERISRSKHDGRFERSMAALLESHRVDSQELEAVAVSTWARPTERHQAVEEEVRDRIRSWLGIDTPVYCTRSHHETHALGAVAIGGFDRAIVAVLDHTGSILGDGLGGTIDTLSVEQSSYYLLADNRLECIARDHTESGAVGYGRAYSKVTRYLGFPTYHDAGRTMGLAAFGDPRVFQEAVLYGRDHRGQVSTSLTHISHDTSGLADLRHWFSVRGSRLPESRLPEESLRRVDCDLAAWMQDQLQTSVADRLEDLTGRYEVRNVCLTGGVALNAVMNGYLAERLPGHNIFIPPSPCDKGLAVGAAAHYLWTKTGRVPKFDASPYLGPAYGEADHRRALERLSDGYSIKRVPEPFREAARLLNGGWIVGWFQGRSEYGPRALGNRSILASPRNPWTKDRINHLVKQREWFRPFAPAVREADASRFFHIDQPSPYMMHAAKVRACEAFKFPACVHVDGLSRLQTVSGQWNPQFDSLLAELGRLSGTPVVLNTSFNLRGMPIVESPGDAVDCFMRCEGLDALILGRDVITRKACLLDER